MKTEKSEYDIQAEEFLKKTNTEFSFKFLKYDKHFTDDKDKRDVYLITLKRDNRTWSFEFGQSTANSGKYEVAYSEGMTMVNDKKDATKLKPQYVRINKNFEEPSAYDILTCITKDEVGTFEDFCSNYGYDNDSIKAQKIYEAVKLEWSNIQRMFTDKEIEMLQEIQ